MGFISSILVQAQTDKLQSRYLLDKFTDAVATSSEGPIRASFNYDCVKQEMQFEEGDEIFRLQPIDHIDTLYLGNHKMIPYANRFVEIIATRPQYSVFIDYKRKIVNKGKKGPMGATQATVENIDLARSSRAFQLSRLGDIAVYKSEDESSYVLIYNKKMKGFKDLKSFLKIFPEKKEQIAAFAKEHNTSFKNISDVISLIEFSVK